MPSKTEEDIARKQSTFQQVFIPPNHPFPEDITSV